MDFKLNIYSKERDENGKRKIEKTYESDTYDLLYGTVEDILDLFESANLNNDDEIFKMVKNAKNQVNDLLKDIFIGITDDELKRTSLSEIVLVIINVIKYSVIGMMSDEKN